MSNKTYGIVSVIIGAAVTAAETIIPKFELSKESAILGAIAAVGTASIAILHCFVKSTEQSEKK